VQISLVVSPELPIDVQAIQHPGPLVLQRRARALAEAHAVDVRAQGVIEYKHVRRGKVDHELHCLRWRAYLHVHGVVQLVPRRRKREILTRRRGRLRERGRVPVERQRVLENHTADAFSLHSIILEEVGGHRGSQREPWAWCRCEEEKERHEGAEEGAWHGTRGLVSRALFWRKQQERGELEPLYQRFPVHTRSNGDSQRAYIREDQQITQVYQLWAPFTLSPFQKKAGQPGSQTGFGLFSKRFRHAATTAT
jgi:hypothetical protein